MNKFLIVLLMAIGCHVKAQSDYNGPLFFHRAGEITHYMVIDGERLSIPTNVLEKNFHQTASISVTGKQLEYIPEGNALSRDAKLVQAKGDPAIYFVSNGRKHHITSPDAFNHYGFKWESVRNIKEVELSTYQEGALLYAKSQEQLEFEEMKKLMSTGFYFYDCDVLYNDGTKASGRINMRKTNGYDACPSSAYFYFNQNGHDRINKIMPDSVQEFIVHIEETRKKTASTTKYVGRDGYFVAVFADDGPLVFYLNPFPTHIDVSAMRSKKLADKIYNAVGSAAEAMNNKNKMTYQKNGQIDLGKFFEDAGGGTIEALKKDQKEITKTLQMIIKQNESIGKEAKQDHSEFEGMAPIWLSEYIIEDKESGFRTMVYRDNYSSFLSLVKTQCPSAWQSFEESVDDPEDWEWSFKVFKIYNECLK